MYCHSVLCTGARNRYLIQLTIYCRSSASTLGWQGKTVLQSCYTMESLHKNSSKKKENIFYHILANLQSLSCWNYFTQTTNPNSTSICPKSYHFSNSINCFRQISIWSKLKKAFLQPLFWQPSLSRSAFFYIHPPANFRCLLWMIFELGEHSVSWWCCKKESMQLGQVWPTPPLGSFLVETLEENFQFSVY